LRYLISVDQEVHTPAGREAGATKRRRYEEKALRRKGATKRRRYETRKKTKLEGEKSDEEKSDEWIN
jgi:hypothetical protein